MDNSHLKIKKEKYFINILTAKLCNVQMCNQIRKNELSPNKLLQPGNITKLFSITMVKDS